MEKRAIVLALALTLPLVLYGVPYAYAISTQSTYVVRATGAITENSQGIVMCSSPSDSTLHYAFSRFALPPDSVNFIQVPSSLEWAVPLDSAQSPASTNENPNGWSFGVRPGNAGGSGYAFWGFCQSPITVAGISVPQFSSLYLAIALGALVYFMLSRLFTTKPMISAKVQAL
jgi:hypothetical protein